MHCMLYSCTSVSSLGKLMREYIPLSVIVNMLETLPLAKWDISPHWSQALRKKKRDSSQQTAQGLFAEDSQQGSYHLKLSWLKIPLTWFLASFYATLFSGYTLVSSTTGALLRTWINRAIKFLSFKWQMIKRGVYMPEERPDLTSHALLFISSSFF